MKAMVIGGTGHVGKFMVPKLVRAGYEVSVVGSGKTSLPDGKIWNKVKYFKCDINDEKQLSGLCALKLDVLIIMTGNYYKIYQCLKKNIKHIIVCGSLWMFGDPNIIPTPEIIQNPCPFPGYAERMDTFLKMKDQCSQEGIVFTAIMPPNICGPGKIPLECLGGRSLDIHRAHLAGKEVILPDGPEVLIGPCDADDIAECFVLAVNNCEKAAYQIFNVGSSYALTATQFVSVYSNIYGKDISVKKTSWSDYIENISPDIAYWWHFKSHMCPDISKARKLLGYAPNYTPEQTIERAVEWMRKSSLI